MIRHELGNAKDQTKAKSKAIAEALAPLPSQTPKERIAEIQDMHNSMNNVNPEENGSNNQDSQA